MHSIDHLSARMRRRELLTGIGGGLLAVSVLAACGASGSVTAGTGSAPVATSTAPATSAMATSATQSSSTATATATASATSTAPATSAALASAATSSASAAPQATAPGGAKGTVQLLLEASENQKKAWQQMVDAFHHAGHTPAVEISNPSDIYTKFDTMVAGGAGPDLFGMETKYLPHYAGEGVALNMDPFMSRSSVIKPSAFFAYTWSKHVIGGHLSAMPNHNAPLAIFYNADMFKEAGVTPPPAQWGTKSWDFAAFLTDAHKLTKTSGSTKVWFSNWSTWWLYCYPFVWGNGGHLFNSDVTQVLVDSPEVVSTYQWLADLTWKEHVQPTPDEATANKPDFTKGTLAIQGVTEDGAPSYLQTITSFKWDVAAIPVGSYGIWTRDPSFSVMACSGTKQPDAAWELAEFTGSDPAQLIFGLSGNGVPARISAAKSDKFLHQSNGVNWQVFVDAIDHEGIQPVTDIFPTMDSMIRKQMTPLWANQATAQTVMTTLKPLLVELLKSAKFRRDRGNLWQQHGWAAAT